MVDRADGEILEWRSCLLNVIAEDVGNGLVLQERNQPFGACLVNRKVANVEPAWIEVVSAENDPGLPVVIARSRRCRDRE